MDTIPQINQLTMYRDAATGLDYAGDIGETTPVSWKPRSDLRFEEWQAIGNTLQQVSASLNWWIGDWLNYGEQRWGEMYAQAMDITGWDYDRLRHCKYVSGRVQFGLRNPNLRWSHHKEVASLEPEEQAAWLGRAEAESWTVRRLREEIKGLNSLPSPALSLPVDDEPDDVPFNHQPRQDVSPDEWTAIDEYEQGPVYTNGNGSVPHVSYNSGNNEWYTPKEYIEAARFVLGGIDLDPASSQAANEVVRASVFYTVEDDGLSRDWRGRVWMNPPYSEDLIGKFAGKLADHFAAGDVTAAIVLVNNATETRWFRRLIEVASAVVFPSSRVRFWRPDGKTAGPLQGQALIYMGEHPQKFREGFGSFGWGATL